MLAPDPGRSGAVTQAATTLLYFLWHQATPAAESSASLSYTTPASRAAESPGRASQDAAGCSGAEGSTSTTPAQPLPSQPGHVITA